MKMMRQINSRKSVNQIKEKKHKGEKITMLTAYDYPLAGLIDQCGIDIILVGDSLANVVLGLDSTKDIGMSEMIHHASAVNRAVKNSLLIGDMPFESYQKNINQAVVNAKRFIEAGCDAVKLEWFDHCLEVTGNLIKEGVEVMGHIGLTPQTAENLGGMKVQGKDAKRAQEIIGYAKQLEQAGCFSIVLECIPDRISEIITKSLIIPTIGIGAGRMCDGQVLVTHDLLGLFDRYKPKFVKQYIKLDDLIKDGITRYKDEVIDQIFPGEEHSFKISNEEFSKLDSGR